MERKNIKSKRPLGGVGVYILNNKNQLLLLLRKSKHANGDWCVPGGHIEYGESFFEAGFRETEEETGIKIKKIEVLGVTSDVYEKDNKHTIGVHLKALGHSGKAELKEPKKFEDIKWFDLNKLPSNLLQANKVFFTSNHACLCGSGKKYKKCHGA